MDLRELPDGDFVRHPWEQARARHFARVLRRAQLPTPTRVLEIGSGDAWFAAQMLGALPPGSSTACVDLAYDERLPPDDAEGRLVFSTEVPSDQFDLLMLCDVLEHVDDDVRMLRDIAHDRVRPGGAVVVAVPAHQALFTAYDKFLGHYRRYSPAAGRELAQAAGLDVIASGGLFGVLLAPRVAGVAQEWVLGPPQGDMPTLGNWKRGRLFTGLVRAALEADALLQRRLAFAGVEGPGLSWWALCRRP